MSDQGQTICQIYLADGQQIEYKQQTSLLDALEDSNIDVHFQCREGFCGACRAKLTAGEIKYINQPLAFVRQGEILPCCCIPVTTIHLDLD